VQMLSMKTLAEEGIASTSANTLWYFNLREGTKVSLQSFHNAPSRMIRSNAAFLETTVQTLRDAVAPSSDQTGAGGMTIACDLGTDSGVAAPEVCATCDDDGCVRIWSSGLSGKPCSQVVAQFHGGGACTALGFLTSDTIACAMLDGCVSVYNLNAMTLVARIEVAAGDPLLALEAISPHSLVVGSAAGQLVELVLDQQSFEPAGAALAGAQQIQLHRPANSGQSSAVCGIIADREVSPRRFLVCLASLEILLWECQQSSADRPRHVRTWAWPESQPKARSPGCCRTQSLCLDLLASPPLVACFVDTGADEAEALVVVCAPPATCFYVYSCENGSLLNRFATGQGVPPVLRLWSPPLRPFSKMLSEDLAEPGAPEPDDGGSVWVLCDDRFARLRLWEGGAQAAWLEEPLRLPGCCPGLWPRCGTPAACWVGGSDATESDEDGGTGRERSFRVVLKGDTALSCWTLDC